MKRVDGKITRKALAGLVCSTLRARGMRELGFQLVGRRATHPATRLFIEFCSPPVAVGGKPVRPRRIKTARGLLDTLSPTHCVMDRLAAFYHWNDRQALEQALLVARRHKIDLAEISRWSEQEGRGERYHEFYLRLVAYGGPKP